MGTRLQRTGVAWRRAQDDADAKREARDAAIVDADSDGWGPRAIAARVGLDPSSVQNVIVRETAARQRAQGDN